MPTKTPRLRIGCVSFLNSRPLIETLDWPVTLAPPSRLDMKKFDAALLPVVAVFRGGYDHVPGVAIACNGKVDSVRLHHRKKPADIRVCALDRNSKTSNILVRVLLERMFGARPRYVMADPGRRLPRGVDAALAIGDNAFHRLGVPSLDLGEVWKRFTGLPFVFALWAHRKNHPHKALLRRILRKAKRDGMRLRKNIARRDAKAAGITPKRAETYLTKRIRFDLGPRERAGLRLFRKYHDDL